MSSATTTEPASAPVDLCADSIFICNTEGLALTGEGYARISSALNGIQTIAAILMQRELDKECEVGVGISQNVAIGLISALGTCTEFANAMLKGRSCYGKVIDQGTPEYKAIEKLVSGKRPMR